MRSDADRAAVSLRVQELFPDLWFESTGTGNHRPSTLLQRLLGQITGHHRVWNSLGAEPGFQAFHELPGVDRDRAAHAEIILEACLFGATARDVEGRQSHRSESVKRARQTSQIARHHDVHGGPDSQIEE